MKWDFSLSFRWLFCFFGTLQATSDLYLIVNEKETKQKITVRRKKTKHMSESKTFFSESKTFSFSNE